MKIAHVATSYPRDPDDPSGHFVRAEALADAWRGHDVHVVAPLPYARDPGVTAHPFFGEQLFAWPGAVARGGARPWRWLAAAPAVGRGALALAHVKPELVVSHWAVPCAWPMTLGCSGARRRVTSHGGDVRLLLGLPRAAREALVARLVERLSEWTFVARSLRASMLEGLRGALRAAVERVSTVRAPAVDVADAGEARAGGHIAIVGRLVRSKRVDLAIAAAREARVPLVVVGDGPEERSLRRLAAGAEVSFSGRLGRRDALACIRGARALVHPSELDAAPTAVLEARALGVPVVAADVGDVALWARTDPGISITRRDAGALAEALRALAAR